LDAVNAPTVAQERPQSQYFFWYMGLQSALKFASRCRPSVTGVFSTQEELPLNRIGVFFRPVLSVALFSAAAALAQQSAAPAASPVPPAILAAKSIFVSNAGADSGLFSSPFSGDPSRGYSQLYAALKATGQFELVADPSQADLVMEIQLIAPYIPERTNDVNKVHGAADPMPYFLLRIYDRKTHYILWTLTQSIEIAYLQKTHDHNFDTAILVLVEKFQQLAGKPITPIP
jgi:hypothetical protein